MRINSGPISNLGKLNQAGPQTSDQPVPDSFRKGVAAPFQPIRREEMVSAAGMAKATVVDVAAMGLVGAALGGLVGYGRDGGFYASLALGAFGALAGGLAGLGQTLVAYGQKPSPVLPGGFGVAGLLLGAAAGSSLVGPNLRLAALVAMGAGAGILFVNTPQLPES